MPKYLRIIAVVAIAVLALSGTASALSVMWFDVSLTMDGDTKNYRTTAATVGGFLAEQNVVIGPLDTITPEAQTQLSSNGTTKIVIIPGFNVSVNIDGDVREIAVAVGTQAGELVRRLEALHGASYALTGVKSETLSPGRELMLNRIIYEEQVAKMPLMYDTETIPDDEMEFGDELVERAGVAGEMHILSFLTIINGQIVKSQIMREDIIIHPISEIVRFGTKIPLPKVQTERGLRSYTQVFDMVATAYTAGFECTGKHPGHPAYGITASGVPVDHGIVAVDPSVIPLGTRLYVEGYGESLAADTGGVIIGHKIDLYHEHREDALRYGRRNVRVYVLN